jgi:membrane protein implicated in regulation of membrane protease activity
MIWGQVFGWLHHLTSSHWAVIAGLMLLYALKAKPPLWVNWLPFFLASGLGLLLYASEGAPLFSPSPHDFPSLALLFTSWPISLYGFGGVLFALLLSFYARASKRRKTALNLREFYAATPHMQGVFHPKAAFPLIGTTLRLPYAIPAEGGQLSLQDKLWPVQPSLGEMLPAKTSVRIVAVSSTHLLLAAESDFSPPPLSH